MGNFRPLPTKCWIKFLNKHGFTYKRTVGSHDQFTKSGVFRTITLRSKDKDVPAHHLKTSCSTMGIKLEDVYKWADENC